MKLLPPEINFRVWKFCHVSRIIIFEDDEILIISCELIFAFAWYVMFLPSMIIEGENRSLQNYRRCTNGIIRNHWVKNENGIIQQNYLQNGIIQHVSLPTLRFRIIGGAGIVGGVGNFSIY